MKRMTLASGFALVCGLAAAVPVSAATDLSFSGLSGAEYDTAGVYVIGQINFTGTDDDGGGLDSVLFQLFDDGLVKFEDTYSLLIGSSGSFLFQAFFPGLVATGAPGVGLVLSDIPNGSFDVVIDPFIVPRYADPSECEKDCGPVAPVPLPGAMPLLVAGIGSIAALRRRRRMPN